MKEKSESESEDNKNRIEMLWTNKIESLFRHWAAECKDNAILHNKTAKKKKCLYRTFGIPSIIIPLCMASFTQLYSDDHYYSLYVNSIGYLITGTLSGINTFLNYASQYEKHYYSEIRYQELYTDIQSILIKPKKDRQPADVLLEKIKLRFEHINEYAPDI